MPKFSHCISCKRPFLPATHQMIYCDACCRQIVETRTNEPGTNDYLATAVNDQFIRARIYDDSAGRWEDRSVLLQLYADGLRVRCESEDDLLVRFGSQVEWPASTYLRIPCEERVLTLLIEERGVDQTSLARDLAQHMQMKRTYFDVENYRLPTALRLIPLASLLAPLIILHYFLSSHQPEYRSFSVWCAMAASAGITLWLAGWAFSGWPSATTRIVFGMLFAFLSNVGVISTWAYESGYVHGILAELRTPIPPDQWVPFVDPEKRYQLEFPGKDVKREDADVKQLRANSVHIVETNWSSFAFGQTEMGWVKFNFPVPDNEVILNRVRDDLLGKTLKANILSEKDLRIQRHPARDYHVERSRKESLAIRHILVGDRLYMLVASGPRFSPQTPDVQRFFDSFKVLP